MDATSKLLLEEMKKLGDRLDDRLTSLEKRVDSVWDRFNPIEEKVEEISTWKKGVDSSVADLIVKLDNVENLVGNDDSVDALRQQVANLNTSSIEWFSIAWDLLRASCPNPTPPAGNPTVGPDGLRMDKHLRENRFGSVMAYTQLPVKGKYTDANPKLSSYRFNSSSGPAIVNTSGRWPKLPFPKFDGDNPKLWQSRCENYFDMAGIDRSNWVRIASMYFEGPAARWLQSVQHRVNSVGWDVFSKLVHDRFGRDHHDILIR
jgi:hypothetical protein